MTNSTDAWAQDALKTLLHDGVIEQRRRRRWGIFFKTLFLFLFVWLITALNTEEKHLPKHIGESHVALINVSGPILAGAPAGASRVVHGLEKAFKDPYTKGVILRINSPGGSPVESDIVYQHIKQLRHEHPKVKLMAVCDDICASGAYYIASAADDIYANPASLVGSIGVIMNGFGFVDAIQKLGISRRAFIAGQNKDFLDPFKPLNAAQVNNVKQMLDEVHQIFIARVKAGRGKRLKVKPDTFTGLVWTGKTAKTMGLIDGFGDTDFVTKKVFKQKYIVDYTAQRPLFERLARRFGASFGAALSESAFQTLMSTSAMRESV
ncbi:MAG: peptidase [marine bacterium B5-7]|nr:MAG: peptidase [marine bacterium B5-7]